MRKPQFAQDPVAACLSRMRVDADSGCWRWTGHINYKGYGMVSVTIAGNKRRYRAHRYVWELIRGPIPTGLEIDHLCRVRDCVNPDHLEPVTRRVNQLRGNGVSGHAARRTHCPRGHEYETVTVTRRVCRPCDRKHAAARRARAMPGET